MTRRLLGRLVLAGCLVLPGCAAAQTAGGGSAPAAPELVGAPIKVMTWAPEGDTDVSYPTLQAVAQAFAAGVNDTGGINGHPLEVLTCDEGDDAELAAGCAHRAVDEDVVAVLGSFSMHSAAYLPVLETARIPYLGGVALTEGDYRSPMSYPISGGAVVRGAAAAAAATETGCARPVLARGPRPEYDAVEAAVTTGLTTGLTTGPPTGPGGASGGRDRRPGPVVLRIPDDPGQVDGLAARIPGFGDCVILAGTDRDARRLLGALQRAGAPVPVLLAADLRGSSLADYPAVAATAFRVSWFPAGGNAVWRRYRDAVRGAAVDTEAPESQNTWAAYQIFLQLARKLTIYDSTSLVSLLDQSGAIDGEGLVPTLSFRVEFPAPGLNRLFNRCATVQTYRDGPPAEVRPGFRDVSATLRGPPRTR